MNKHYDLKTLFWVLCMCLMVYCLIVGIMCNNPLTICFAMFAFSIDGLNAWNYFKLWREWRKVGK